MANKDNENKIKKFTKEAIGKTLNGFNKEIGMADLVEINKNQDRILNGILSQVNDENTEKTEKSNVIMLDNSTDGIVELQEIQGDTNVNVSKIVEETPITHVIEDKEGNAISLNSVTEGAISIDNIQGNTMVNCNKEPDKEIILNGNINTQGYSNVTITEGVDGGLVDIALEGNTMVNVCDQKDPVAITKSYTVETGNHIALQGEYDGKCRPVVTGNTLWIDNDTGEVLTAFDESKNLRLQSSFEDKVVPENLLGVPTSLGQFPLTKAIKNNTTYTIVSDITGASYIGFKSNTSWVKFTNCSSGYRVSTLTVKDASAITKLSVEGSSVSINQLYVFEGDYTNYDFSDYGPTKIGKYMINYVISKEDGTVGQTKTFYLNSPLLEGDTIEQQGDNVVHVHRYGKVVLDGSNDEYWENQPLGWTDTTASFMSRINIFSEEDSNAFCDRFVKMFAWNNIEHVHFNKGIINITISKNKLQTQDVPGFKEWLHNNPTTVVYKLATPQYEVISQNDTILCDSYVNGHLDVDSVVPIEKVDFLPFTDELTYLYANTQYTLQFTSDKAVTSDITLGGTKLLTQSIVVGLNKIVITTPKTLVNNKLIIDGVGTNISHIVVTEATDQDFGYFEGMKSVGECEDLEVVSSNKNLYNLTENDWVNYGYFNPDGTLTVWDGYYYTPDYVDISVLRGKQVYIQLSGGEYTKVVMYDKNKNLIKFQETSGFSDIVVDFPENGYYIRLSTGKTGYQSEDNMICEEGDRTYIPHASNTQTLTHEPLRAVGDVKDKYVLIDGKWYIERNCAEIVLDGSDDEVWSKENTNSNGITSFYLQNNSMKKLPNYINAMLCNKLKVVAGHQTFPLDNCISGYSNVNNYPNENWIYIFIKVDTVDDLKQYLQQNPTTVVYQLASPTYEPIDYNPFEVYSSTTHISNNSTIPCNMTIKNTGYNCLLKPSTTYTVSSNLGLNTVTTPAELTEDCLRFYDTDTSDVTTMKNVTVLEGDYTTGKPLPSHFSGIESAFEQEYDEAVGKYKVKIRVQNEDASKENYIEFYIDEPLRGIGDVKDKVYVKNDKVVVERNCGSVTLDGSEDGWYIWKNNTNCISFAIIDNWNTPNHSYLEACNYIYTDKFIRKTYTKNLEWFTSHCYPAVKWFAINLLKAKLQTQDVEGFKQWLQQNPTTVVYQLAEPTYEEVEYQEQRLLLDTYNNSTLFYESNIPVSNTSFKPLWEELVYLKNSTKYYIQFNSTASGTVVFNLGGTEVTKDIVEGYNNISITTPAETTNLLTIDGHGIKISEVVVSESVCSGHYLGLQSCFEEHMENGKYRVLLRGIALDGSKVNGIKLYIDEPLRGIGDVKDKIYIKDDKVVVQRNCAELIINETNPYEISDNNANYPSVLRIWLNSVHIPNYKEKAVLCDILPYYGNMTSDTTSIGHGNGLDIHLPLPTTSTISEAREYLKNNPLKVVYQLAEPTYEEVTNEYGLPIVFEGYENGIVYIDSAVTPTTHIKYTSNNQLATTLAEAEEQNIATQEDINMNVITYMMDIDMILTDMEMSNDTSVMAVRRDNSNENMLDRMSDEDKKVYRDNTVVMLEKMITAKALEKEDIEGRIDMYYNKNRISKEQYKYLKSLL